MATIRIAEDPHPAWAGEASSGGHAGIGGVYPMRRLPRAASFDRRSFSFKSADLEDNGEDEDAGLRNADDYRSKQVFSRKLVFWLAYQSIGVIYGDIGTSPLYVFSGTFTSAPSHENLLGALSLVIWSLTLMVTVKYILVILHADNDGEGGTFSTYSLLSRYINITERDPREASFIQMHRYRSGELGTGGTTMRTKLESSKLVRGLLKTIGVLAVTMVLSDGVLTPAQSVLGAVQGLEVAIPDITKPTIVGTTCGLLILLFMIQPLGVEKISFAFAPIIVVWLAFNAAFGVYNLIVHDHSVLSAFNPGYAFIYLARNKIDGWRSLGGILLSFTGVEALFADLGAFSRHAIQLSWLCYCFPCLLLAYVGQAAYISDVPEAYSNPFFNAVPPHMLIPSLVIAVLAAIVASQAIITASFQLLAQIMKLSYFPQIKVVHTSKVFHGQLYVPLANWLLMIGTVLIAAVYNNTTSLGNAYGVCVMFVTFFDTCMVTLVAIFVWRFSPFLVFLPWLAIACMDGAFLSSALTKVPDGAWFTLTLAAILAAMLIEWRFGKEHQWAAEAEDRFPTSHFLKRRGDGRLQLTEKYGGSKLSVIKGFGIFFDKAGETTPIVFSQFVNKLVAAPEVMVFFHLRPLERPTVPPEERYSVSRLGIPNCYRLVVRHGYMDRVITPELASLIFKQVRAFLIRRAISPQPEDVRTATERPAGIAPARDVSGIPLARLNANGEPTADSSQQSIESAGPSAQANIRTEEKGKSRAAASTSTVNVTLAPTSPGTFANATSSGPPHPSDQDGSAPPSGTTALSEGTLAGDLSKLESAPPSGTTALSEGTLAGDLSKLESAYNHQVLYIIGKEAMRVKSGTGFVRTALLNAFLWIRENTRNKVANLKVPTERVVEIGFLKDV